MNFESYTANCETTESFKKSLPEDVSFADVMLRLEDIIATGERASKMKRAIYYRTDDEGDEVVSPKMMRLIHSILGRQDELGEIASNLFEGLLSKSQEIDVVNLEEEEGDMAYYTAMAMSAAGLKFDNVINKNLAKLSARYGGSFSVDKALNRDLVNERSVLEG